MTPRNYDDLRPRSIAESQGHTATVGDLIRLLRQKDPHAHVTMADGLSVYVTEVHGTVILTDMPRKIR